MPSDIGVTDDRERRLHPLSWLFIVLQQLRSFALPLIVLIVTGGGDGRPLIGLIGVGGIAIAAVARYLTFRFRFGPEGVVLSSGVFQRTRRDIPYERIHDVAIHQSVLHRVFGVAEVRLESAGGKKAEGEMRVLSMADAQAIEALVRERRAPQLAATVAGSAASDTPDSDVLLALPTSEVVRLGLISNRGMVLVAAAVGAIWQALPDDWPQTIGRRLRRDAAASEADLIEWMASPALVAGAALAGLAAIVIVLRLLSVALALLQFHGFTLTEMGRQLRIERGLFTRHRNQLPSRRIQAWHIEETLLHRWFGRQSVRVDSAGSPAGDNDPGTRDLVPLADPARVSALLEHLLPGTMWPPADWNQLHPRAWRRLVVVPSLMVVVLTGLLTWRLGAWSLVALAGLPLIVVRARVWAARAGWTEIDGRLVAVRHGWLRRSWDVAEISKLQTLRLSASPFDRRHGMATLWLDTAGARSRDGAFRIPYLPAERARDLYERLAARLDHRAT
jgi:putative membrane protein